MYQRMVKNILLQITKNAKWQKNEQDQRVLTAKKIDVNVRDKLGVGHNLAYIKSVLNF